MPRPSREATQRDIDDELALHLHLREEEFLARGMTPAEAREAANRRFGDVERSRNELRSAAAGRARLLRLREWVASVRQDAAFGVRSLAREPGFSLVALSTLILGFGATTAVATVAYRYLVAPLPLPGAEQLLVLDQNSLKQSLSIRPSSLLVRAWREGSTAYERLEVLASTEGLLRDGDQISSVTVASMSPGLLEILHVLPVLGRRLTDSDSAAGNPLVAMLPWRVWKEQYSADTRVLGRVVHVDGRSVEIIGVLPKAFDFSAFNFGPPPRLWLPYREPGKDASVYALALPKRGISVTAFEAALTAAQPVPSSRMIFSAVIGLRSRALPLAQTVIGRRSVLLVLYMAVGVLLIACVNVAHLLLARGTARARELFVRAALGAERGRIIRQLFTENLVLAVIASAGGALIAMGALRLAAAYRPAEFAAIDGLGVDVRILGFLTGLSAVAATLFGLLPALLASQASMGSMLRGTSRTLTPSRAVQRLRAMLACSEMTVSVVLLIGAGLLARSAWRLDHVPLGYEPAGVLSASLILPQERYGIPAAANAATRELRRRVAALPGVQMVSVATTPPHMMSGCFCELMPEGQQYPETPSTRYLQNSTVDSAYFSLLGLKIIAGRTFSAVPGQPEVMLSETTARKLWPGTSAVGKRLRMSRGDTLRTVIGVVSDLRTPDGLAVEDNVQIYSLNNESSPWLTLVVRVAGNPAAFLSDVSRAIIQFDPSISVHELTTSQSKVTEARARTKFTMMVFSLFASIALVLASVGLYGVLAYSVEQRRGEIGIRMALGAPRSAILRGVLRQGTNSTVAGMVLGVVVAIFASRSMDELLFETKPSDPATYVCMTALLLIIAVLAMVIPARRASRIDPATVLRADG